MTAPTANQVRPPADPSPRTARPSGPAVLRALATWAIGCGGVVAELAGHGPLGAQAAVLIALLTGLAVLVLQGAALPWRNQAVAVAALGATGMVLVAGNVGRAPVPWAFATTVLAHLALVPRQRTDEHRPGPPAVAAALALAVASAAWAIDAPRSLPASFLLAGAALVTAHDISPPVRRVDAAIARAVSGAVAGAGRVALALLTWCGAIAVAACSTIARGIAIALRREHRPILWASIVAAVVTAPIFHRAIAGPFELIRGTNDIPGTLERVRWMEFFPPKIPVPHPGWSTVVKVTMPVVGEVWAVTLILALATGASTAVLITIARSFWDDRPPLRWPLAITFGLGYVLMENPAIFAPRSESLWSRYLQSGTHARGQGYLPLHQWSTPTITLSMPIVFALFALVLLVVRDAEQGSPRLVSRRRMLAVLTVISTLVQPATTLAVVPALPIYLIVSRRLTRPVATTMLRAFVLPGTVVVLWQVWFLASNVSPWEQATWLWRPMWSWSYFGLDRPAYWTPMLLGAICLWAGGRRYLADEAVGLSFLAFCVGMGPFLFLEQTGIYGVPDGDLGVPPLMAYILWFTSSLRFALLEVQRWWEQRPAAAPLPTWAIALAGLVAVMIGAGVSDLLSSGGFILEN
jgi:hypothetical protein